MKHFNFTAAHRKHTGGRQNQCHGSTMLSRLMLLITLLIGVGSSGYIFGATSSWTASNTTYTAGDALIDDPSLTVQLGSGTWIYNSGRGGITNNVQGSPSDGGAYIVISPKVDINFILKTYSSMSNCNLRMYEKENPSTILKDFRQKGEVINDFGILKAGKTYYIYGDDFKTEGDIEYVFFKSFTAKTYFTVNFSVEGGASIGDSRFHIVNKSNGNSDISNGGSVNFGDVITITSDDWANHYYLKEWQVNGVSRKDNIPASGIAWWHNELSFDLEVNQDVNIKAMYTPEYILNVENLGGGTVSFSPGTLNENQNAGMRETTDVVVTCTPPSGNRLRNWKVKLKNGDTELYSNLNWSKANPLTINMNQEQFAGKTGNGTKIVLEPEYVNENNFTITWDPALVLEGCDAWFTVGDDPAQYRTTHTGNLRGKKVTYHARTNSGYNALNRWYDNDITEGDNSLGWNNNDYVYTDNLSTDIAIFPEFLPSRIYAGYIQDDATERGEVIVHSYDSESDTYNDDNINGKYSIWSEKAQFVAVAKPGYKFVRWSNESTANPRIIEGPSTGQTYQTWATFESAGIYYDNPMPILRDNGTSVRTYYQERKGILNGGETVTYSLGDDTSEAFKEIVSIDTSTGALSNIPAQVPGIIVVHAETSESHNVAEFCLTVPGDLCKWNFYQETDGSSPIEFGSLANIGNDQVLGSAAQVKEIETDLDFEKDPVRENAKTNQRLIKSLKRRRTWLDLQDAHSEVNNMYDTWNYTFKTFQRQKIDGVYQAYYTNEELFSYAHPINGENGRIVKNTGGLVFKAEVDKWGVNDARSADGSDHRTSGTGADKATREKDRSVLMCAGTSMTIPVVKAGRYIRVLWYRHSDDAGDRFMVENGIDLDGKKIVPTDVLRFTGSIYSNEYYGYTIFKVGNPDDIRDYYDVKITAAVNGWTEVYQVEILDKYETDFRICQTKVEWRAATDDTDALGIETWRWRSVNAEDHAKDINNPTNYNSERGTDSDRYGFDLTTDDWKYASRLVSRIQTHAFGASLIKEAPSFYIMGHPGQNRGWSGWLNLTAAAEVMEGTANCILETDNDLNKNGVVNMIPNEQIRIGHDLDYTLPRLQGVTGTGAIKLVFRTHSGNQHTDEPHYTLNKTEAWVAVGEYSVQKYPYTWDFTKYNMDRANKYSDGGGDFISLTKMSSDPSMNTQNEYGNWDALKAMQASESQGLYMSEGLGTRHELASTMQPRHKRFFAQGAQLTIGDNMPGSGLNADRKYTILETEGLRFRLNDGISDGGNSDVKFVANAPHGSSKHQKAWGDGVKDKWEDTKLNVTNTTITVPEVDKGMYVFVRSSIKPASVTGATDYNNDAHKDNINMVSDDFAGDRENTVADVYMKRDQMHTDGSMKSWVYKVDNDVTTKRVDENGDIVLVGGREVADVVINFTSSTDVEAIGVTDEFKMMTNGDGWATDSRQPRIDYSETYNFTKHDLRSYVAKTKPIEMTDPDASGQLVITEAPVVPGSTETSEYRGLILEDKTNTGNKSAFDAERRLIPLFVPACNIPNSDITGNLIKDHIDVGNVDGTNVGANANYLVYVFTNKYYNYDYSDTHFDPGKKHTADGYSYYIVRQGGKLRANSSYLRVPYSPSLAKQFYLFLDEGNEEDAIEAPAITEFTRTAGIYTIGGMKLDAMPSRPGIYIVDGKKISIK